VRTALLLVCFLAAPLMAAEPAAEAEWELRSIFETTFAELWRNADTHGLAALWTEDGEWMSLVGSRRVVRGRESIAGVWEVGLRGRETKEALAIAAEVQQIRMLDTDLAQVDVMLTFGTEATGVIREAMFANLRATPQGWRIVAARVARIPEK